MTEAEAEALLRRDLMKRYALFRSYGKDALLLTVLSYNVGTSALLGYGKRPKSRLLRKLEAGDRDIYREYISYCHYRGRKVKSIERRRKWNFYCFMRNKKNEGEHTTFRSALPSFI